MNELWDAYTIAGCTVCDSGDPHTITHLLTCAAHPMELVALDLRDTPVQAPRLLLSIPSLNWVPILPPTYRNTTGQTHPLAESGVIKQQLTQYRPTKYCFHLLYISFFSQSTLFIYFRNILLSSSKFLASLPCHLQPVLSWIPVAPLCFSDCSP